MKDIENYKAHIKRHLEFAGCKDISITEDTENIYFKFDKDAILRKTKEFSCDCFELITPRFSLEFYSFEKMYDYMKNCIH